MVRWLCAPCTDCADLMPASYRAVRGGSFDCVAVSLRAGNRIAGTPTAHYDTSGFVARGNPEAVRIVGRCTSTRGIAGIPGVDRRRGVRGCVHVTAASATRLPKRSTDDPLRHRLRPPTRCVEGGRWWVQHRAAGEWEAAVAMHPWSRRGWKPRAE